MNCFEWQNFSADYLDGNLSEPKKRATEEHLESCKACNEKIKHYRILISAISNQPKVTLPPQIRKAPLSTALPRIEPSKISFSTWELIPWTLRTTLETIGIILAVLLVISSTPKIRNFYEKSFEKSLSDFNENLNVADIKTESIDHNESENHLNSPVGATLAEVASNSSHLGQDEISGENEGQEEEENGPNVRAGKAELWRFVLKTVSPDELRSEVIKSLVSLGISDKTPGLSGTQVPGGIEFDLLLPQTLMGDIKRSLEKLAPKVSDLKKEQEPQPGSENFTWYKVKSKRKVPAGKSQVMIWLSQPHFQ